MKILMTDAMTLLFLHIICSTNTGIKGNTHVTIYKYIACCFRYNLTLHIGYQLIMYNSVQ